MKAYIKTGQMWGVLVMESGERFLFTSEGAHPQWGKCPRVMSFEGLDEISPEELFPRLATEARAELEKQRQKDE